jgi:bifunctional UDP-N-acetylglucosamine pyrophosphorylase/glucosamine-1-phosphate N-acetyltransferase
VSLAKQRNAAGWVVANRPGTLSAALAEAAGSPEGTPSSSSTPASTEEG